MENKTKENAYKLIWNFYIELGDNNGCYDFETARRCAIISCNSLINEHLGDDSAFGIRRCDFWQSVKSEILNL